MLGIPESNIIELPHGLSAGEVMDTLRDGHSYTWRILVKEPRLMAWGTVRQGRMPEIILVGRRMMLSDTEGDAERLRNLLDLLARRKK